MYINHQFINLLESLCIVKNVLDMHPSLYKSNSCDYAMKKYIEKSYTLFSIYDEYNLFSSLGIDFLSLGFDEISYKEKINHIKTEIPKKISKPNSMLSYANIMSAEMTNISDLIDDFILIRLGNDYTNILTAWQDYASCHNVNIDQELAPILKVFEETQKETNELKKMLDESLSLNKEIRLFFDTVFADSNLCRVSSPLTKNSTADKLFEAIYELKDKFVSNICSDNFEKYIDLKTMKKNNYLLVDCLLGAYNILKDKINMPPVWAVNFSSKEDNIQERYIKFKENIILSIDNIRMNNVHYNNVIVFKDKSCAVLIEGNSQYEYFVDLNNIGELIKISLCAYFKMLLKKNPTISKSMCKLFENSVEARNRNIENSRLSNQSNLSFVYNNILLCMDTYFKNENILRAEGYDFIKKMESGLSFEHIDDMFHKTIREHKIKQYMNSIVSNKYKVLYNKKTVKLFEQLYDLNIERKIIQEMIGKKLALVSSSDQLNDNIKILIKSLNEFDLKTMRIKAVSNNAKFISEDDNMLIIEVSNYGQAKKLGSNSWCISRDEHYFNHYTENECKQYFIYDFKQSAKSVKSMLGLTLTPDYKLRAAYTKSDSELKDKVLIENIIEKVIKYYRDPDIKQKETSS